MYAVLSVIPGKSLNPHFWLLARIQTGKKFANPWFATKKTPTMGEKILLSSAKSNLTFLHSYNVILSASLPNFSLTYGAQGITDTNLLYKVSWKKIHKWV